jgi:multicomponent Na+:H+ antiporter subunit D
MNAVVPLPVVVPLVGAAVILFFNTVLPRRWVQAFTLLVVLAEVGMAAVLLHEARLGTIVYWFGGWTPRHGVALGISFTVDQIGAGGALVAGVVVAAAVATTRWTIDDAHGIVHALLLTLLAAMAGFCLTGDLFDMFVFFELMAVSAFALMAFHSESRAGLRCALNFAVTNSIGAFMVLIGIALLYGRTGALNLAQIGRQLVATGHLDRLTIVAFSVVAVGFLIKAGVVPFHFWLIDTAASAPIPLVMIFAGLLDTLGVYGVARIYWTVLALPAAGHGEVIRAVLIAIGALSAIVGGALALVFHEARRRLGFVMVSHTGILLVGAGCLSAEGVAGAGVYAVGDGAVKAALFVGVALVGLDGREVGHGRRRAGLVLLALGGLATAGLPVFATGLGKAAIEDATGAAGFGWVTPIVILAAVLSAGAVLDLAFSVAKPPGPPTIPTGTPVAPWRLASVVGAGLLGVSAAATFAGRWATGAAFRFVDSAGYQQRVLGGPLASAGTVPAAIHLSRGGLVVDLLTVVAAVGLAASFNLGAASRARSRLGPGVRAIVARLHDGSIGDSVTWVTLGTATIALVFAAGLR